MKMTSRLLLLQIVLFGFALTIAKKSGDLREKSNLDLTGPAPAEDDAEEQEYGFESDESSEQRNTKAPQNEEIINTALSSIKMTDGTSETTKESDMEPSSTQVFTTTSNENSNQASSANTMRRDISDTASTMPSTKHDSADEMTVTKTRPSTSSEDDELLDAATKVSDSEPSTSDILITATMDITQREFTVTPRKYISGSTSAMSSESTSTPAEQSSTMMEGVIATVVLPSASTGKVELLEVTTEASKLTESTSQDDFTQPSEKSTSNSVTTMRRDVSETVSTMPSTSTIIQGSKQALTNEFTTVTMLSSTAREMDRNLNATTEVSDLERSTSQVVFSSTEKSMQADPTATMRKDVSKTVSTMPPTSTITQGTEQVLTKEVTTTAMLSSTAREMDQKLNATTKVSDLEPTAQVAFSSTEGYTQADPITTMRRDVSDFLTSMQMKDSTAGETETQDAASKASTFTKRAWSTTTLNEVSSAATTKRTFLENDDPITNASTTFLSTATTIVFPNEESVPTITSKSTITSSIIPTILPSTETDYSHTTSTPSTRTTVPSSTSTKVASTTTFVRPTTAESQTCFDAKRIGNRRVNCSIYRRMCHIKSYKNMLKKYCPVTCGYCKLCVDQIRNRRNICTRRSQFTLRMCNHKNRNIRADTRKRCPVTCGVCSKGSVILLR